MIKVINGTAPNIGKLWGCKDVLKLVSSGSVKVVVEHKIMFPWFFVLENLKRNDCLFINSSSAIKLDKYFFFLNTVIKDQKILMDTRRVGITCVS